MSIFDNIENWLDEKLSNHKTTKTKRKNVQIITGNNVHSTMSTKYNSKNIDMNKITINGETFEVEGNNIVVKNGKISVDGKVVKENLSGNVKVEFTGDLAKLDCTSAVINGNVQGNVDCTSAVITGNVQGDVDGTTIKCGDVGGDVDGTNVQCGNIQGDVDAVSIRKK